MEHMLRRPEHSRMKKVDFTQVFHFKSSDYNAAPQAKFKQKSLVVVIIFEWVLFSFLKWHLIPDQ